MRAARIINSIEINRILRLSLKSRMSSSSRPLLFASQIPITVTDSNPDSGSSRFEIANTAHTSASAEKLCRYCGIKYFLIKKPNRNPLIAPNTTPIKTILPKIASPAAKPPSAPPARMNSNTSTARIAPADRSEFPPIAGYVLHSPADALFATSA